MNNLKRVLSLGLVGTMLTGMMVIGAGAADFSDAEKITHDDAVNTLVALNVINGKPDGTFDPEGNVTRAEMAKMIAVAMNGGTETTTGTKTTPTFTDIKGTWAESYIEYCSDLGIISGRGDGTFDPTANVTGLEAAKMVLTALGYDSEAYKLTGDKWASRTDELARSAKPTLYTDLTGVAMALPATRDTAAQLIWNGLQNWTKRVSPLQNTNTGEVTWQYGNGTGTLLKERYDADVLYGTLEGNDKTVSGLAEGHIQIAMDRFEGGNSGSKTGNADFPYDTDLTHIGEEVKVIYRDGKGGTNNEPDKADTIYGVFPTGATKVVTGVLADVKDQKSSKQQINIGGTKYDVDNSVDIVVNYCDTTVSGDILVNIGTQTVTGVTGTDGASATNSTLTTMLKKSTGDSIKAILNTDNEIDKIYVVTTKLAAVTAVNSSKITLNNNVGSINIDDNDVEDGLKKGDVVTVSTLYKAKATDDGAYSIVKKAETVSGEVDGYKGTETVKVDGTNYNIYNKAAFGLTTIPGEDNVISKFEVTGNENKYIEEEVTLYMVNGYVAAAVQTSESASNYSLITEVKQNGTSGSVFDQLQLQVMAGDGTKSIITVSDDSKDVDGDGDIDKNDYGVGDIVTYTMDDGEAVVSLAAAYGASNTAKYDDSVKTFGTNAAGDKGVVTTTDCVLFVQTKSGVSITAGDDLVNGTFKAFPIRDLKSFTATGAGMTVVYDNDDKVVAAFANYATGTNPSGATSNTIYGIISAVGGRVKDYYIYDVQANGETYTINSKDNNSVLSKGDLVWFEQTTDNNYPAGDVHVLSANANNLVVYTKEAEADNLTFYTSVVEGNGFVGAGKPVTLAFDDDDTPIIYVDVDNSTSTAEGSIGNFDTVTGYANAFIVTVTSGSKQTIKAVFIETSNEDDILAGKAGANGDSLKVMEDGMYVPTSRDFLKDAAGTAQGTLNAAVTDISAVRIFKFTASENDTYKLEIKDSANTTVYEETSTSISDGAGHFFYISTQAPATTNGAGTNNWTVVDGYAAAGTYTYTITAVSADTVVASGSFSL